MEITKNQEYIVDIIDDGIEGEGIAKINDYVLFIPYAIKGEKIKIKIIKTLKNYGYGRIIEIIDKSPDRIEPVCTVHKRCGGCNFMHVNYDTELKIKQNAVENTMKKILGNNIEVCPIIEMENIEYYRNKTKYPLGKNKEGKSVFGFYASRTHEIIKTDNCYIENEQFRDIAKKIIEILEKNKVKIYDEETKKGYIKSLVIKIGIKTNEIMLALVTVNKNQINKEINHDITKEIIKQFPQIKTIIQNIAPKNENIILGEKNIVLYGDGYITDYLGEFKFKISLLSFYQVNPIQTEKLYSQAIKMAELTGKETVFDLYSGIGTIGIFVSKYAKKVCGIEIVEEAVRDAEENLKINKIENVQYIVGKVEEELPKLTQEQNTDVVFIDPPRKGLDENVIKCLLNVKPKKIVYISCNPATLARDLKEFSINYNIGKIQPVDMFPRTKHIECVCLLELR